MPVTETYKDALMRYINNHNNNPYFNLALEEYLLKNSTHEFLMLWQNSACIVIGKNQSTLLEINVDYVKDHNITVVRRLTGGGAVYHDLGNVNYTFIVNDCENDLFDFKKHTQPIIEVLHKYYSILQLLVFLSHLSLYNISLNYIVLPLFTISSLNQPLTAPAAMPSIILSLKNKYAIIIGKAPISIAVILTGMFDEYCP